MFIDSSAFTAVLTDEPDARSLAQKITPYRVRLTSPMAIGETTIAVARILVIDLPDAERLVTALIKLWSVEIVAVPSEIAPLAIAAYRRYGKTRHPAALNFGDCFSYACARHHAVPLLYKGNDFAKTDIEAA